MKDTFAQARLIEKDLIRLGIFSSLPLPPLEASLLKDGNEFLPLDPLKMVSAGADFVFDFKIASPLELGHSYFLKTSIGLFPLDVSLATEFPGFDEVFDATDEILGPLCDRERSSFCLFAPLASKVILKIRKNNAESPSFFAMSRSDNGCFHLELEGDWRLAIYTFLITNSETTVETIDPYAKGSTQNSKESVLICLSDFETNDGKKNLPPFSSLAEAVIYEGSVRDLTICPSTDIEEKGRFLGLAEKGKKTKGGHPAGFDYLTGLGISHLQLLPIFDFATVDETNPSSSYNWGYDPAQYFVPEGSYASRLEDPLSRIVDLKKMVEAYHGAGIRIVMDVVFNHVYDFANSSFEKSVPNFYFRKRPDGSLSNASGCGNVLFSERPMVRKLIFDAACFWIDFYGVDGFRFDLMGLLDQETILRIWDYVKKKDPSFVIYGEGWEMGGDSKEPLMTLKAASSNPCIGFFNDAFRESAKRLTLGDVWEKENFLFAFLGSSVPFKGREPRFALASQSINYLECHDNETLYDYLSIKNNIKDGEDLRQRVRFGIALTLFSFGVPFIHAGEEIGLSKFGRDNTYNAGDAFNQFDYDLLDERWDSSSFLKHCISLRKALQWLQNKEPSKFVDCFSFEYVNDGLRFCVKGRDFLKDFDECNIFINPSDKPFVFTLDADQTLLLMQGDTLPKGIKGQSILVPKFSLLISALGECH